MMNRNLLTQTSQQLTISKDQPLTAIVISTLSGILLNFDVTGAKIVFPDEEWNAQPENIFVGPPAGIQPRPNPPIPEIPAGPLPVLPVGPLNAAVIKIANMNLNYHTVAMNKELAAILLCIKYSSILQYVKSALLNRAFAIDQEAHSILIINRITNLPDRLGIPLDQVLANLWDHYETFDEAAKT